jgi:cation diffusion facilitator family transporter
MASPASTAPLYREVTRAASLGLVINFVLGAVKLVGGFISGSVALISDALNSLGDVLTSVIVLVGIRVAQRAPDAEHPYGHTRAETIAASNVAVLIIFSALFMGWQAIHGFSMQHDRPPVWTLWIAGANVLIKESLYRYKMRVGKRTGSQAIVANAWDHRNDALSSFAVLIGLSTVYWGGPRYFWADEAAAIVVVGAVVWAGVELFLNSASELMDRQASKGLVNTIRQTALDVPGVQGVEKLWVRKSGLEYFADIHIEVDPHISVAEGHRIGHVVKDRLLEQFAVLRDVLVHLEPHPHPREPDSAAASRAR